MRLYAEIDKQKTRYKTQTEECNS